MRKSALDKGRKGLNYNICNTYAHERIHVVYIRLQNNSQAPSKYIKLNPEPPVPPVATLPPLEGTNSQLKARTASCHFNTRRIARGDINLKLVD
jgi:hypothetical protein